MNIPAFIFLLCGIADIFLAGIDMAIGSPIWSAVMLGLGVLMLHLWADKRAKEHAEETAA